MARTPAGALLTEQHRQGQLQIRALALQGYLTLWPLWRGDADSFRRLSEASIPLIRVHHQLSSNLAAGYFEAFRAAEKVKGSAAAILAPPPEDGLIVGTLFATGQEMTAKAISAGQSADAAMQTALTRTSGSVTRLSLAGGRETLVASTRTDRQAQGWTRVTDAEPCAFCAMLAGNGPVYSEEGASFEAHDSCGCTAEPTYSGSEWPGRAREFRDLYNQATRDARAAGDLKRGTKNDLLNAFRRSYGSH